MTLYHDCLRFAKESPCLITFIICGWASAIVLYFACAKVAREADDQAADALRRMENGPRRIP